MSSEDKKTTRREFAKNAGLAVTGFLLGGLIGNDSRRNDPLAVWEIPAGTDYPVNAPLHSDDYENMMTLLAKGLDPDRLRAGYPPSPNDVISVMSMEGERPKFWHLRIPGHDVLVSYQYAPTISEGYEKYSENSGRLDPVHLTMRVTKYWGPPEPDGYDANPAWYDRVSFGKLIKDVAKKNKGSAEVLGALMHDHFLPGVPAPSQEILDEIPSKLKLNLREGKKTSLAADDVRQGGDLEQVDENMDINRGGGGSGISPSGRF